MTSLNRDLLQRPIFIVGSPRSGTSILGKILRAHPAVVYLGEPRLIWKHGNEQRSDVLRAEHASNLIASSVRERLLALGQSQDGLRLVEKTPQNALRLEFVDRIFPDCLVIHVIRNGRSAVPSIRDNWLKFSTSRNPSALVRRFREMDLRRAHHYIREGMQRFLPARLSRVVGRPVWGPQLPGIQQMLSDMELIDVCCLQWRWSVESACNFGRAFMPANRYLEIRLEEFGRGTLERLVDFVGLEESAEMWRYFEESFRAAKTEDRRDDLTPREKARMDRWLIPTIRHLGYE